MLLAARVLQGVSRVPLPVLATALGWHTVPMVTLDASAGPLDAAWRLCLAGAATSVCNSPNLTAILAAAPPGPSGPRRPPAAWPASAPGWRP